MYMYINAFVIISMVMGVHVYANTVMPSERRIRSTGDAAPPGECLLFSFGGLSNLHWYSCCNNCNQTDMSCDGQIYQSASTTDYCDSCGRDGRKGDGWKGDHFPCGGCTGQSQVEASCKSGWQKFVEIPGFCWVFAKCFQEKCQKKVPTTCYNNICEAGETVKNCPVDCCATVNPEKCTAAMHNGTCLIPQCCGNSTCCNSASTSSLDFFFLCQFFISMYIIL